MAAFRTMAGVIFAAIFFAIFANLYLSYRSGVAEREFMRDVEALAGRIRWLAHRSIGSTTFFSIDVPGGCELWFEKNSVIAWVKGEIENHKVGIPLSGASFGEGEVNLTLERFDNGTFNGVRVLG